MCDAFWQGEEFHFLAFGFDSAHAGLRAFCEQQFAQYALNYARIHPVVERRCGVDRATLIRSLQSRYTTHPAAIRIMAETSGVLRRRGAPAA